MLAKVLMCSCFVEKFHSEDNEYVKKPCHLKCKSRILTLYIFSAAKNTRTSRAYKFCLKGIPESFHNHIETTYQYFKKYKAVNLFMIIVKNLVELTFI